LAIGIKTAIAKSGKPKPKPKPKHKHKVRKPKMKNFIECDKVQADNLDARTADRKAVMELADELGVELPIRRNPTPKSQKDAAKERQQSIYNEDGQDYVFCGHNLLSATEEVNKALDRICPGIHGQFSADDLEHAHTWAICDQKKNGIWGGDTCHEVHLLQTKCHRAVDAALLKSQAEEREEAKAKKRTCTNKRSYIEISSDEEDELNDTCHELDECYACGEARCECPPRLVGA
jgi:hypothetical protein